MEELQDINFLATIEGQDYEESLRKIVSSFNSPLRFSQFLANHNIRPQIHLIYFSTGIHSVTFHTIRSFSNNRRCAKMCRQDIFKGRDRIWYPRENNHLRGL